MGIFSFLFGDKKSKVKVKEAAKENIACTEPEGAQTLSNEINPEIVAVIAAAAYAMLATEHPGVCFKINRISNVWAEVGRQKLMDSRKLAKK